MAHFSCHGVSFFDAAENQTVSLELLQPVIQGFIRAFPPEDFAFRIPEVVFAAEVLYDLATSGVGDAFRDCPWGAAVLGAVLWLSTPLADVQFVFGSPHLQGLLALNAPVVDVLRSFQGEPSSRRRGPALLVALWAISAALRSGSWAEAASAWPLFAVLALVAERLAPAVIEPDPAMPPEWGQWLATSEWDLPLRLRAAAAGRPGPTKMVGACRPGLAAASVSMAAPGSALAAALPWVSSCVDATGAVGVLSPAWAALWRGLDRLCSPRVADVTCRDPFGTQHGLGVETVAFRIALLPPHIRGSERSEAATRFLADRIRARGEPHCNPIFRTTVSVVAEVHPGRDMNMVDVGAHLGDCCLWAAARWGPRARCVSVEANEDAAAAIDRSIELGSFAPSLEVQARMAGPAEAGCGNGSSTAVAMDCLLSEVPNVDVVKIHTGGAAEFDVLRGLVGSLRAGKVGVCVVRTTAIALSRVEAFVRSHALPYHVSQARDGRDTILRLDTGW